MLDNWDNGRYSIIDPSSYSLFEYTLFALHCYLSGQSSNRPSAPTYFLTPAGGSCVNEPRGRGRIWKSQRETYGRDDQHVDVDQGQAAVRNGDKFLIPAVQILWTGYKSTRRFHDRQILRGRRTIVTQRVHAYQSMSLVIYQSD